jgi:hypothetical protein
MVICRVRNRAHIVWFWAALAAAVWWPCLFDARIIKMAGPAADHGVGSAGSHLGRCQLRTERPVSATGADCLSVNPIRFASFLRVP